MENSKPVAEEDLKRLVHAFYAKVRLDRDIGPVFNDAIDDWSEHLEKLQAFWSSVMLKTGRYDGRPMPAHIRHAAQIDRRAFERWLAIWKETTAEMFPPEIASAFQLRAERIAESLQLGIHHAQGRGLSKLG